MNPQHIVYIGLVLVGLGVSICAIDPLKPEPIYVYAEGEIIYDMPILVEQSESWKHTIIGKVDNSDIHQQTFYPKDNPNMDYYEEKIRQYYEIDIENIPDVAVITSRCDIDGFTNDGVFDLDGVLYDYCVNVNGEWYLEVQ